MKFLIDAHLSPLICNVLNQKNHDAIHVKNMHEGDDASDQMIIKFADSESRIVITKDADFYYSHILTGKPHKLLLIKTGNIKNKELLTLIRAKIGSIELLFENYNFLELNLNGVVIRES